MIDRSSRGQSEVVGVILLLAVSMTAIGMILFFGQGSILAIESNVQSERTMNEFALLDSKMATAALGGAGGQRAEMNLEGGAISSQPDAANFSVEYEPDDPGEDDQTWWVRIGNIEYEHPDRDQRIAYEGGGVWTREEGTNQSVMVSPPEFHYRELTLTLPMFNVTSEVNRLSPRERFAVEATETNVFDESDNLENPLPPGNVTIWVTSDYYRAWEDYFLDRTVGTDDDVESFDENNTVKMRLPVPEPGDIEESVSIGEGNNLVVGDQAFIDSYDSDLNADYFDSPLTSSSECSDPDGAPRNGYVGTFGDIATSGSIDLDGEDACVFGDVSHERDTGSSIGIENGVYIHGNVNSTDDITVSDATIGGAFSGDDVELDDDDALIDGDVHANDNGILDVDDAEVDGNAFVDGNQGVECDGGEVTENAHVPDENQVDEDCVDGDIYEQGETDYQSPVSPTLAEEPDDSTQDTTGFSTPDLGDLNECSDSDVDEDSYNNDDQLIVESTCVLDADDHEQYLFTDIEVEDNAELRIEGDIRIFVEDVSGQPDGGLVIDGELVVGDEDEGGSLEMTVEGDAIIDGKLITNEEYDDWDGPHKADQIMVYMDPGGSASGQDFYVGEGGDDAQATGAFFFVSEGNDDIEVFEDGSVFGALIAADNNVEVNGGSVHYDESLQNLQLTGGSQVYFLHLTENKIEMR